MGNACSSDQGIPPNVSVHPCPRHKMNPQRDCRACQEFMRSRRPEPRGYQVDQRVQQRYSPHIRGHEPATKPQGVHHAFPQGRSTMPNQRQPQYMSQHRGPGVQSPPMMRPQSRPMLGGPSQQIRLGPSPKIMGRPSQRMMFQNQAAPMPGPSPENMGGPSQRMMSHNQAAPLLQGMSVEMPSAAPQIMNEYAAHIPQQVNAPQVIHQGVVMPSVIQAPARTPCVTEVIVPQQYEEVLPAPPMTYEPVAMSVPKEIIAPALPPCPTDITVQEMHSAPQHTIFQQQPPHGRIQPVHQQSTFK